MNSFFKTMLEQINESPEKPIELEFGNKPKEDSDGDNDQDQTSKNDLIKDMTPDEPDAKLADEGEDSTLADLKNLIPKEIEDLAHQQPASLLFALSFLIGGSRLVLSLSTVTKDYKMRNFCLNTILLLVDNVDNSAVQDNLKGLLVNQLYGLVLERLKDIGDRMFGEKTEMSRMKLGVLHDQLMDILGKYSPLSK